jgi:predicted transcriptional regulator
MADLKRPQSVAKPAEVRVIIKMSEALDLRAKGYSYKKIAETMQTSPSHAFFYVKKGLERARDKYTESTENYKALELHRYDYMLSKLMPEIKNGNVRAIETALKIEHQRSNLLGLYPETSQLSESINVRMYTTISPDSWDNPKIIKSLPEKC